MTRNREDRDFEQYRLTKKPRYLAKVFDRTSKELHRVARHLATDSHRAEDLVQSTYLTAIEDASSWNPDRPLLPWLLGILANRARYWRREERDLGAEVPDSPYFSDPLVHAANAEFTDAAREAVRSLPEPYCQVLIMHLEHGMTAKEIAEVLHRPAGTVRTQVVRAMDLLRKALPLGFAAGLVSTVSPAQCLAAVRVKLMATVSADSGLVASVAATSLLGGILVMKKTLVSLCVAGLVAVSVWLFGNGTPLANELDQSAGSSIAEGVVLPTEPLPSSLAREDVPAGIDNISETQQRDLLAELIAGLSPGSIRVRARYEDGTPARGVALHARMTYSPGGMYSLSNSDGSAVEIPKARETLDEVSLCDDEGSCVFEDLVCNGHFWAASVQGEGTASVQVGGGKETVLEIVLRGGMRLEGQVVDSEGQAVAGAMIDAGGPTEWPQLVAQADLEGRFTLRCFDKRTLYARAEGYLASRQYHPPGAAGSTQTLRMQLGVRGVRIAGRVLDRAGVPAEGIRVALVDISKRFVPTPIFVTTGAEGRFQSSSVRPGRHLLIASATPEAREHGIRSDLHNLVVPVHGLEGIEIGLIEGATVYGQAFDLHGKAKQGVRVALRYRSPLAANIPFTLGWAHVDASGQYRADGLTPGRYRLEAVSGRTEEGLDVELFDKQHFRWDPRYETGKSLRVRVVDDAGQPRVGWEVTVLSPSGFYAGRCVTDRDGESVFEGTPSDLQQVWVTAPDITHEDRISPFPTVIPPRFLPGASWHEVLVRAVDLPTVTLRGQVVGTDGKPFAAGRVTVFRDGDEKSGAHLNLDPQGRFSIGPIPAYRYRVGVSVEGKAYHAELCSPAPESVVDLKIVLK